MNFDNKFKNLENDLTIAIISFLLIFIARSFAQIKNINIFIVFFMEILAILIIIIYLYKNKEININTLFNKKNIIYIVIGFILMRIVAILFTLIGDIIFHEHRSLNDSNIIKHINLLEGLRLLEYMFYIGIVSPIREEFIYRYLIICKIGDMKKEYILISAILCGFAHKSNNIIHFLMYFLMSIILSITYYRAKQLDINILIHMLNNIL